MFNINNRPIPYQATVGSIQISCAITPNHTWLWLQGGHQSNKCPPKVVSNQRHRRPNFQLAQEFTISGRGGTEGLVWEKGRLTLQQNVQTTSNSWHQHSRSNSWHQYSRSNSWHQHPTIMHLAINTTWTFKIDLVSGRNKRDAFLRRAGWINELGCRSSQI